MVLNPYKEKIMPESGFALFWNPSLTVKIVTQVIGLGAVELCCERQLARWKAFLEVSPPSTIIRETPIPPVPKTRTEKIRGLVISLCILSLAMLPMLGLVNLVNKDLYLPQVLIDGMWTAMLLWLWTSTFASALYGIFPRKRYLKRVRGKGRLASQWDFDIDPAWSTTGIFNWSNPKLNTFAGFICASLLLVSVYYGYRDLLPFTVGAQVISSLVGWLAPKTKMKTMVQLQGGVMLLFIVICGIVTLLAGTSTTSKEPTYKSQPSPWLVTIMTAFQLFFPYAIPGAFMIVNMRYEYNRVTAPPTPGAPGESVLIDHRARLPSMPLYNASMIALAACCAFTDILTYFGIQDDMAKDMILILVLGIPAVIGTCAVYTWLRGDIKEWWSYTENYRPEINVDEVIEVDEDGKAVTVDEKQPISP